MSRLAVSALLILVAVLVVILPGPARAEQPFRVTFIDVGQGDSAWLQTPDGQNILIDGGRYDAALSYLQAHGSPSLDVLTATHPDADHIGGLVRILDSLPVYRVLESGQTADTQTYRDFANLISIKAIPDHHPRVPELYTWGCCVTARVLNPVEPLSYSDTNNNSVVLKVSHGTVDFLFTGDAESAAENDMIARGDLAAEVLKVSHHGSAGASSVDFLAAVHPKEAVISVGPNSYGHPAPSTLTRLNNAGARIWRTDQQGTIEITSDGTTYTVLNAAATSYRQYLPLVYSSTLGGYTVSGVVYEFASGSGVLRGATVTLQPLGWQTSTSLSDGTFAFANVPPGSYSLTVSPHCTPYGCYEAKPVTVANGDVHVSIYPLTLTPTPTFTWTPTPTSTPVATSTPLVGGNLVCNQVETVQICGSVSNTSPNRNSNVTVYGRLLDNGERPSGLPLHATWHYKSTTSTCDGTTSPDGIGSCSRNIGGATSGYTVNVDVTITYNSQSYIATTSFTPN